MPCLRSEKNGAGVARFKFDSFIVWLYYIIESISFAEGRERGDILVKKYRPWYVNVDRRLFENSVGWIRERVGEKITVLLNMFAILYGSEMPEEVAHKFAKDYQSLPIALREIGRIMEAERIVEVLKDLAGRKDGPKKKPTARVRK